jgi:general secretion pathway protein G
MKKKQELIHSQGHEIQRSRFPRAWTGSLLGAAMLVLLACGIVAGADRLDRAGRIRQASYQIAHLQAAIELYELRTGALPNQEDGLRALTHPVHSGKRLLPDVPRDPWGGNFHYQPLKAGFSLSSRGPDGKPGTGDDIEMRVSMRASAIPSLSDLPAEAASMSDAKPLVRLEY